MKNDLIQLAQICLEHARRAKAPEVTAALTRMAREYQRRAQRFHAGDGVKRPRAPVSAHLHPHHPPAQERC
jgi:hypothetical protein